VYSFAVAKCAKCVLVLQSLIDVVSQHSWVLGIDKLAKWQKDMLQLKRFGGSWAIILHILDK
jgi:hypothetical protein